MPRYDYECGTCGHREEHTFSMADMPSSVACAECAGDAARVIDRVPECFMKNRPYEFRKDKCVVNFGKNYGRSARQQVDMHRREIEKMQRTKRELANTKLKHTGAEWLGSMPGEMVTSIGMHEDDPEAVVKDPVSFLKKTGLYQGD